MNTSISVPCPDAKASGDHQNASLAESQENVENCTNFVEREWPGDQYLDQNMNGLYNIALLSFW